MHGAEALLIHAHRKATLFPGLDMHSDDGLAVISAFLEALMDFEVVGACMHIFKQIDDSVLATVVHMVWRRLIGNDGLYFLHKVRMIAHLTGRVLHTNSEIRLEDGLRVVKCDEHIDDLVAADGDCLTLLGFGDADRLDRFVLAGTSIHRLSRVRLFNTIGADVPTGKGQNLQHERLTAKCALTVQITVSRTELVMYVVCDAWAKILSDQELACTVVMRHRLTQDASSTLLTEANFCVRISKQDAESCLPGCGRELLNVSDSE
jgi:hypothetical protein